MAPGRARRGWIEAAVAWGAAALLALPAWGAEPQRQSLQGTWELNPDLTAQLRKDQPQPERSGGGRRGGGMGGGMGRHRGGGMGGSRGGSRDGGDSSGGDPAAGGDDRDHGGGMGAALARLTIVQGEGAVTITDDEGRARVFKTDGSKVRDEAAPGGPAEVQAAWDQDGSLLVSVKPAKGASRTESYVVSNDRKHLYLTLTTAGGFLQPDRKSVRAYDLVPEPPESKPDQPAPPSG
jgi:hypothetical protein